ncbi:MAG: conserved exported protein of unknown function [Methanothrix sp.]|jgi:hypothetical protein|nr:MAG: conserved exported protein of unknown function [Methanothrix sp.]
MKTSTALSLVLIASAAILTVTASASPAFQDGFVTGFLSFTGEGQTEIVSSNLDRWKGFSNTEVLYGKGSIDYFSTGFWNQSAGVATIDRKIEFPKGLLVNVQHFDSSRVFNRGSGVDISNVNVVSSYSGMDRMVISENATTFDVKSEFDGIWNLEAFRNDINRKIDTKTTLDGKFEINKELTFR